MGNKSSTSRSALKEQPGSIDLERGEGSVLRPSAQEVAQRTRKYNPPPPLQLPGQTVETDLEAGVGGYSSQQPRINFPEINQVKTSSQPPRKKSRPWFSFLRRDDTAKASPLPADIRLLAKPCTEQPHVPATSGNGEAAKAGSSHSLNISASVPLAVGGGSTVCQVCGRWASITCHKCCSAAYCGKRCMLQHAAVHAAICRQLAREQRMQASNVPEIPEELKAVVETSCSMAQVPHSPRASMSSERTVMTFIGNCL